MNVKSLPEFVSYLGGTMSWSRDYFAEMLQRAIADDRNVRFIDTVEAFRPLWDIGLGDDGSFESLCNNDNYVPFIHELLECWVESVSRPWAYPYIQPTEWAGLAGSLLDDIKQGRIPSHSQWNNIYTLRCESCNQQTTLDGGRFYCKPCERDVEFQSPSL